MHPPVRRLLDGDYSSCPLELVHCGDLTLLIDKILGTGTRDTVRVTEAEGHADEDWTGWE